MLNKNKKAQEVALTPIIYIIIGILVVGAVIFAIF